MSAPSVLDEMVELFPVLRDKWGTAAGYLSSAARPSSSPSPGL